MATDGEDQCWSQPPAPALGGRNALENCCLKRRTQRGTLILLSLPKQQDDDLIQINIFYLDNKETKGKNSYCP